MVNAYICYFKNMQRNIMWQLFRNPGNPVGHLTRSRRYFPSYLGIYLLPTPRLLQKYQAW